MNENKKMTSIARKINMTFWLKRLGDVFAIDLLLICIATGFFFYEAEQRVPGNTGVWDRDVEVDKETKAVDYVIILSDKTELKSSITEYTDMLREPAYIILIMEGIHLFFALFNTNVVRKKMRPLNDLAVQAQQISYAAYDTSKFESLEQAITNAHAESPDVHISTGDKDLQSIEIALNNLLLKMKESERQQARFVSDASHELRTPISVIQGYVNMLDRWGKEDEEVLTESIEALKNESEHMKELIEQLLFLARGDSGKNSLHVTEFNLSEVMREVWEESCMIDDKHEYKLSITEDAASKWGQEFDRAYVMSGDLAMIKQSVRIFVQNAAKYSEEGSCVSLGVKREGTVLSYIVQDDGVGMNSTDVVHIFERFFRSDKARNSETGGSGLGLSIAKWIVDAHDGTIDVLSRADIGTRFTVSFQV
ncbi:MAG: HAMP domain-containing histidine kinase [Clostridium sp.]|nr:HAMP domain-containing histidine kinase [Clostridium sp.]MCM1399057.1 HAMP domain-containing histidine kinase [Clostridium sp.]MCM1459448.1 HAMP domain-containing histidine kinase [Bacteroides sp.]